MEDDGTLEGLIKLAAMTSTSPQCLSLIEIPASINCTGPGLVQTRDRDQHLFWGANSVSTRSYVAETN